MGIKLDELLRLLPVVRVAVGDVGDVAVVADHLVQQSLRFGGQDVGVLQAEVNGVGHLLVGSLERALHGDPPKDPPGSQPSGSVGFTSRTPMLSPLLAIAASGAERVERSQRTTRNWQKRSV